MAFLNLKFVRPVRLCRLLITVMLPLFCTAIHAYADNSELEYRVKSAFLFNFTKFIEWPIAQSPRSEFVMCVVGNGQLHAKLIETIGNKQHDGKPIQFAMIKHPGEAQNCQMVFLGFPERERLGDWIGAMSELAVLTVSDEQDFINLGGMIQFVIIDGKIRFDINQSAANRLSIKMSSKLLGLARNVN